MANLLFPSNISRVARRAAQLCLVMLMVASLSACRSKDKGQLAVDDPTPGSTTTSPSDSGLPVDAQADAPRPDYLSPIEGMQKIHFDTDAYTIRASELGKIEANLAWIKANPDVKVYIEGHCDERNTTEYNFNLGNKRANAIRDYFVKNGIPADQLTTLSKGEDDPIALGHDESAWSQNRRAEFKRPN